METILVVDDAEEVLNVVVRILEIANFVVLQATSGPNALGLAANYEERIDLLLSDVQMPGMSGPQLADTLRQSRPDIRVILMSAFMGGDLLNAQPRLDFHRKTVRSCQFVSDGQQRPPDTERKLTSTQQ